jgi:hypothetical protein
MDYDPSVLTAAQVTAEARAAQVVASPAFSLAQYLPDRTNDSLSFNFDASQTSLPQAASYRAFDATADFGSTEGTQSRSGRIPPISRMLRVDEFDTLVQQIDGGPILENTYRSYARRIAGQIQTRVELARGQALEFGQVTLDERRLKVTIDFGRKASHSVTAATLWSNPAADILGDLTAWNAVYTASNGSTWADVLVSTQIATYMQRNTGIITAALGRTDSLPPIVSRDAVQQVLDAFGLGRVVVNDEQAVGTNGAAKRVISANKVVFLPSTSSISLSGDGGTALGGVDWGITAESVSPKYGITAAERAGIFGGVFSDNNPEGRYVLLSATALPVLEKANATFVAQVAA